MANINLTLNIIQVIEIVLQLFQLIAAYRRARANVGGRRRRMKILKLLRLMGTYRYTRHRRDVWAHLTQNYDDFWWMTGELTRVLYGPA